MSQVKTLETRILKTIQYFDILDMPITAVQVWRYLIVADELSRRYSLHEVINCLRTSLWLKNKVDFKWGYYALKGRIHLLPARLHRHILASQKWKITRRIAKVLMYMPFVRMIAGSGSLALNNTGESSDLDLFIVARHKRIWTARLFLLLATQLTGRRRKYWDQEAPDKLCLNHYVSSEHLELNVNRNIYTAILYAYLVPLSGKPIYKEFMKSNQSWMRQFIAFDDNPGLESFHSLSRTSILSIPLKVIENILVEPTFDFIEKLSENIQRRAITKHANGSNAGRVVVSDQELAFHPGTKEREIVEKFLLKTS